MYVTELKRKPAVTFEDRAKYAMQAAGLQMTAESEEQTEETKEKQHRYIGERITHKMVCDMAGCKGRGERQAANLLYLRTGHTADHLIVRSPRALDKDIVSGYGYEILAQEDMTEQEQSIQSGDFVVIMDTRLVPVVTKYDEKTGKKHKVVIRNQECRIAWVESQLRKIGAEPVDYPGLQIQETDSEKISFLHKEDGRPAHTGYAETFHYSGVVEIRDADAFRNALTAGVGRNKAYGCGMLLALKYTPEGNVL